MVKLIVIYHFTERSNWKPCVALCMCGFLIQEKTLLVKYSVAIFFSGDSATENHADYK